MCAAEYYYCTSSLRLTVTVTVGPPALWHEPPMPLQLMRAPVQPGAAGRCRHSPGPGSSPPAQFKFYWPGAVARDRRHRRPGILVRPAALGEDPWGVRPTMLGPQPRPVTVTFKQP